MKSATLLCTVAALALAACGPSPQNPKKQIGAHPDLPEIHQYLLPPMHVVSNVGWKDATPKAATGLAVKAFAKAIADAMASDYPDRFVSTIARSKRKGKVLIDYLRNQRNATAVAAYSTRARPGAAVSAPVAWEELGDAIGPAYFTVENMPQRLAALRADPWDGFRAAAVPLERPKPRRRKSA